MLDLKRGKNRKKNPYHNKQCNQFKGFRLRPKAQKPKSNLSEQNGEKDCLVSRPKLLTEERFGHFLIEE